MALYSTLKFSNTRPDFFATLNKRVNEYFRSNGITRHANSEMIVKTIFMFCLYFIPYGFIVSGSILNIWALLGLCMVMGLGKAGIGLSIMHDANHGSYSTKGWVNDLIGYSLNVIGGNAFNWKVQHNVLHHTYTNVHEADEDISPRGVLRMSPQSKWKPLHRFQHIYAWVLYGLLTFVWITAKDYGRIFRYNKDGLVEKMKANIYKELLILFCSKLFYFAYILVIPTLVLPYAWWQVFIGFFTMHYVSGFILAVIFQPAHVVDGTDYPEPDAEGRLENSWAVHQLRTTTNFAQRSKIFSWYVGGLNLQVEHHLFPNICHVHYRKIANIVKTTAEEFNLPYKSYGTFAQAIVAHAKLLKELGQPPLQTS